MMKNARLTTNLNLTIHSDTHYHTMPIQLDHGVLIHQYLQRIDVTLQNAISEHPRTLAVRIDLRLPEMINCPDYPCPYDNTVISKFIASLKAQVAADLKMKGNEQRIHSCTIRYIWVRERDSSSNVHYHLVLLFNNDTYNHIGDITAIEGNLAARIKKAWASSLGMELWEVSGLVNFTENGLYRLNCNSPEYNKVYHALFERLSYFAKANTKHYGEGCHSFGSSRE